MHAGGSGWLPDELDEAIAESNLGDRLRFVDFVPHEDLPLWYSAADCFVMPSLYEGFGLPLLEAMACGTPAIASNRSSLPEVAGEAAIYCEPDSDAIGAALTPCCMTASCGSNCIWPVQNERDSSPGNAPPSSQQLPTERRSMTAERVRDISEFELIHRLRDVLPDSVRSSVAVSLGIGDDTAAWQPPNGESVLVTTDSLIDTIHFRTDWTSWLDLGWKSLAVNISDIAAMGGIPALATVSLALTGDEMVADLAELYRGMGEIAQREGVVLAGGDIVRAPHDFGIHVTVLGTTQKHRFLSRSHAEPGDIIAVTGTLGAAAAGLALLQLPADDPRRLATTAPLLIAAHTRPEPRVRAGGLALEHGAHAAMDLSDGLFGDLPKILAASGVDADIDLGALPVAASIRALFPDRWLELATRGGEDYELLLAIPPNRFEQLQTALRDNDVTITSIGRIGDRSSNPILRARDPGGNLTTVTTGAFDHFRP